MNAILTESNTTTNHTFTVNHEGEQYNVTVYLNESGKFIDDCITNERGDELDYEGDEGQIRDDITDYLDENWDKLVG